MGQDSRTVIKTLFSPVLLENEDFPIVVDALSEEMGLVSDYTELFPTIINVDKTPEKFIQDIAHLVSYPYQSGKDHEAQREIVKRYLEVYRQRGTTTSIEGAADFAQSKDWVGGSLFISKEGIPERFAKAYYPSSNIFRHNVSTFSGKDAFQDNLFYRNGVLVINVSYLDDHIKEEVRKLIPAGIKYYFIIINYTGSSEGSDNGEVSFGEYTVADTTSLSSYITIKDHIVDTNVFSLKAKGRRYRSGRKLLYNNYERGILQEASFLPQNYGIYLDNTDSSDIVNEGTSIRPFEARKTHKGFALRSTSSSRRSGKYSMSGTRTGEIGIIYTPYSLDPFDMFSDVSLVSDLTPYDAKDPFTTAMTDVLIDKRVIPPLPEQESLPVITEPLVVVPFEVRTTYKGMALRSTLSASRSSKYGMSGSWVGEGEDLYSSYTGEGSSSLTDQDKISFRVLGSFEQILIHKGRALRSTLSANRSGRYGMSGISAKDI